jgi:hypothetical protein
MTDAEFAPHLAALSRCVEEGFRFREIPDGLHGFRIRAQAIEVLLIRDVSEALAARYRMADLDNPGQVAALWSAGGSVAAVVAGLLSLPNHGDRGAPSLACYRSPVRLTR